MSSLDWDSTKRKLAEAAEVGRDAGVTKRLNAGGRAALDATAERTAQVMAAAQALLASDLSSDLNNLVAAAVKGSATIYDKAMDANYLDPLLRPGLGGSYHRLFDGGHTIAGAVRAARDASPDDTIIEEALGTVQALLRDAATPRGLLLATWDKSTFDAVAGSLESTFAIPKRWFYDLNTYDAADLLGASVGVVAVVLGWNRADTETFASLTAGMGLSAAVGANPLLLVSVVVAAARAFHKARCGDDHTELVDGGFKGAVGSGATMAAIALATSARGSGAPSRHHRRHRRQLRNEEREPDRNRPIRRHPSRRHGYRPRNRGGRRPAGGRWARGQCLNAANGSPSRRTAPPGGSRRHALPHCKLDRPGLPIMAVAAGRL